MSIRATNLEHFPGCYWLNIFVRSCFILNNKTLLQTFISFIRYVRFIAFTVRIQTYVIWSWLETLLWEANTKKFVGNLFLTCVGLTLPVMKKYLFSFTKTVVLLLINIFTPTAPHYKIELIFQTGYPLDISGDYMYF